MLNTLAAKETGSLTRYICRILTEKGLSATDVELRAGGKISYSLIAAIAAGECENLRFETLRALAKGLGVAQERLFAVAIGSEMQEFHEADFAVLHDKYQDLADEDKPELEGLLALLHREMERMLLRQNSSAGRNQQCAIAPQNSLSFALPKSESLREFVYRTLKEKRLTLHEVEQRSKQKISAAYVSNIINDRSRNLTIEKIKALGLGLGVNPQEIFTILEGNGATERRSFKRSIFATLYHKYNSLAREGKKDLRLMMRLVDREIDQRQMQKIRLAENPKLSQLDTDFVHSRAKR